MKTEQKKLHQLFFPIFLETLFTMLAGTVDTLMLSTVGDAAVGAVGTVNTYIGVFIIMFTIISSGMVAVMTQYIGAGRPGVAHQALKLGLIFNTAIGLVFTLALTFGAEALLRTVGIAANLMAPGRTYLQVVGAFCLCNAIMPIYSSYLRSFGHTAPAMAATVTANILNLVLNALFLFGFHWGVWGVAMATGISRLVNTLWLIIAAKRRIKAEKEENLPSNREIFSTIIRVGLPAALESSLYNLAIAMVTRFLNQMDAEGIQTTARSYAAQITCFSFSVGVALCHANAILVGWRIGAGKFDACNRGTHRAGLIGVAVSLTISTLMAIFAQPLIGIFTDDPEMIRLVSTLLIVDIALEAGRVVNLVYGTALKTSGDAVFPMVIAIIFAFLFAAGGTWFFGLKLGWLAVGAYVGMALDECVRAVGMIARWQSGKWKEQNLVK